VRPNPDRHLRRGSRRRGSSEREPGCQSTAKPGGRSHTRRWRPGARCAGTRTTVRPADAPPKRAARDPMPSHRCKQRRLPHIRRRRSRRPPRQPSTDVTAALWPPAGDSSTCERCWSEDHRTLGAADPRRGAATAQPTGDDRGEPRTSNRRPETTTRAPEGEPSSRRHAPEGVCARMTSRTEVREAGCSQGDTASELGKLDYRALLPSRIRALARPVRLRAGRCSPGLPPLQGFLPRGREPAFTGSPLTGLACDPARRP